MRIYLHQSRCWQAQVLRNDKITTWCSKKSPGYRTFPYQIYEVFRRWRKQETCSSDTSAGPPIYLNKRRHFLEDWNLNYEIILHTVITRYESLCNDIGSRFHRTEWKWINMVVNVDVVVVFVAAAVVVSNAVTAGCANNLCPSTTGLRVAWHVS